MSSQSTSSPAADLLSQGAMPATYRYALQIFDIMASKSMKEEVDGKLYNVWTGHTTKLVTEQLKLSIPYYSKCMGLLTNSGCVQQIRRGSNTNPSKIVLLRKPTVELFDSVVAQSGEESPAQFRSTSRNRTKVIEQRQSDLHDRISNLEQRIAILEANA